MSTRALAALAFALLVADFQPSAASAQSPAALPGWVRARAPLVAPGTPFRPPRAIEESGGVIGSSGIEITTEIVELARALEHDPRLIYEYVRNTIDYTPIYGSIKGATMTLLDGIGNDFDQTSLYIALMRVSGFTSNYIYGLIRLNPSQVAGWLGVGTDPNVLGALLGSAGIPATIFVNTNGTLAYIELEHVWAKSDIGGTNYVFDPSFKLHALAPGWDLADVMGYDQSTFLARATEGATVTDDYVEDLNRANIHADLAGFATGLVDHIAATAPGAKLMDVIGGREITWVRNANFVTTLPYEVARYFDWTEVPSNYEVLVRLQHLGIDTTMASSGIYGKRLTLVYGAGGAPELRLDGSLIATGGPSTIGNYYPLTVTVDHPYLALGGTYADQTVTMTLKSGGQFSIMNGYAVTRRGAVEKHQGILRQLLFDGEDPATEPVRGETLTVIGTTWLAENSIAQERLDAIADTVTIQHHTIGVCGQVESPYVDIPGVLVSVLSTEGDADAESAVFFASAGIGSAFEWGVFEQLQPFSAVCTVKLIDLASSQSDKIFDAASANWPSIEPQLVGYSAGELALVEAYINAGFRVILPQDGNLTEGQWTGFGFIAISPGENGIGHIISGALSGGFGTEPGDADPGSAGDSGDPGNQSGDHAQSPEPIDLVTGDYLYERTDFSIGSEPYPFGLAFTRSYNSASRLVDGVLGLGWTHNFDVTVREDTDGFQGLGEDSPSDAAAVIAELFVAQDVLAGSKTNLKLVTSTLAHRWFMDRLIQNLVIVTEGQDSLRFVKLPDGSYNPPPGSANELVRELDQSFLLSTKHGVVRDFDLDGRLSSRTDRNGNAVVLSYAGGLLQSASNSFSRTFTFSYAGGRLTQVDDGEGRSASFGYDGSGNLVSVTDVMGEETGFDYDLPGRLVEVTYPAFPLDPFVRNTYDALDHVVTQSDGAGNVFTYSISRYRAAEENALGSSTVWYFDRRGNTLIEVNGVGKETSFTYDGQNRKTRMTHPEGDNTVYEYDARHNLTRTTENPKPPSGLPPIVRNYAYDATFNLPASETDPLGRVTSFGRDAQGNLLSIVLPTVNGETPTVTYTVNAFGLVETQTDAQGMVQRYAYDPSTADLVSVTVDDGGLDLTWQMIYDARGNLVQETDPRGNAWFSQYDARRLLVQSTTPAPFSHASVYTHDANGNLVRVERETGDSLDPWQTTEYTYDPAGGKLAEIDPEGNATLYDYDAAHRLWHLTDAEGRVTTFQYDPAGRLAQIIDGRGVLVQIQSYTNNGRRLSVTDGNGNATTYQYEPFDRLDRINYPGGGFERLAYDAAGNILQRRTRSGALIDLTYDALDRLATKSVPAPAAELLQFSHDLTGRLTSVVSPGGTLAREYDGAGRLVRVTQADGRQVESAYDAAGNRTSLTYPDGYVVTYEYDAMDRPIRVKEGASTVLAELGYDALSRRVQVLYANGASVDYDYEPDDDVAQVTHGFTDGALGLSYTHDRVHNRLSMADGQRTLSYGYDAIDQLVQVAASSGAPALVQYTLDGAGNRQVVNEDGGDTFYGVNSRNQYTTVGGIPYSYDGNGNLSSDGRRALSYDQQNRLIGCATDKHVVTFGYDALGRRIGKSVAAVPSPSASYVSSPPPVVTRYVHDGNQVIFEYHEASGQMLRRYVYTPGIDDPIALATPAATRFYHLDGLGSVVAQSDASGALAERYSFDAYGAPSAPSSGQNPYTFAARHYDAETGLYHYRKRDYDPGIGRFLQPDPIGYLGGLNLYRYVSNNPLNWLDPLGLFRFGKRPLSGMPWIPGGSSNPIDDYFNTEISHEHGFFEDDLGGNIGFGQKGRFSEDPTDKGYRYDDKHYDDALMREALKNVQDGDYSALGAPWKLFTNKNNCQDWAERLRDEYHRLEQQRNQQPSK